MESLFRLKGQLRGSKSGRVKRGRRGGGGGGRMKKIKEGEGVRVEEAVHGG